MIIPATSTSSPYANFKTGKPSGIFDLVDAWNQRRHNGLKICNPLPHVPKQTRVLTVQGFYIKKKAVK